LQVNSEASDEGVGEGTGGDGKSQTDEDEYRRYDYKDPTIQLLCRSYIHIWGTKGEHIGWRKYKDRRRRRRSNNIRFNRTMMMSLIFWISSTGV
jgi:hypothetical protein